MSGPDKVDKPILVRRTEVIAAIQHGYVLGYIHCALSEVDDECPSYMVVDHQPNADTDEWILSMFAALMSAKVRKDGTRKLPEAAHHDVDRKKK